MEATGGTGAETAPTTPRLGTHHVQQSPLLEISATNARAKKKPVIVRRDLFVVSFFHPFLVARKVRCLHVK